MVPINPRTFPFLLCIWTILICTPSIAVASNCDKARQIYESVIATSDYQEKADLYHRSVALCPYYAEVHDNLADAFEHLARYDETIVEYWQALKLNSDLAVAFFGLGDTYLRIGLFEKAQKMYEEGLKLEPIDHLAQVCLSITRRGMFCAQEKELIGHITILNTLKDFTVKTMRSAGIRASSYSRGSLLDKGVVDALREMTFSDQSEFIHSI